MLDEALALNIGWELGLKANSDRKDGA